MGRKMQQMFDKFYNDVRCLHADAHANIYKCSGSDGPAAPSQQLRLHTEALRTEFVACGGVSAKTPAGKNQPEFCIKL